MALSAPHRTAILRGAASEARVTADLFDRGYGVFKALANWGQGDLVAVKNGRCILIEVKTGFVRKNGKLKHGKGTGRQPGYDVLALVTPDLQVRYEPEFWGSGEGIRFGAGSTIAPQTHEQSLKRE